MYSKTNKLLDAKEYYLKEIKIREQICETYSVDSLIDLDTSYMALFDIFSVSMYALGFLVPAGILFGELSIAHWTAWFGIAFPLILWISYALQAGLGAIVIVLRQLAVVLMCIAFLHFYYSQYLFFFLSLLCLLCLEALMMIEKR